MNDIDDGLLAGRVEALYASVDEDALARGTGIQSTWLGGLVYGELTTPSRLFRALALSATDVFVDLGSDQTECSGGKQLNLSIKEKWMFNPRAWHA